MTTEKKNELEIQLQNLIGQHADWLSGDDWQQACDQVGRAHFGCLAEQGEIADQMTDAFRKTLKIWPGFLFKARGGEANKF
ncbi:hypothetical protein ACTXPD_04525 [Vreelandella alkaliphila]|uniref:hypothetical protein n=1 Tax=Vreelandella alkaliphila TaxID=272774 RepID=UPI003FD89DC4